MQYFRIFSYTISYRAFNIEYVFSVLKDSVIYLGIGISDISIISIYLNFNILWISLYV